MEIENISNKESKTIAEIYEKNIKEVIKNRESFLPLFIKGFSDIHREYNKHVDQLFKMTKVGEGRHFGEINQEILKIHEMYADALFKPHISQTEVSKKILENYLEMHLLIMQSWNTPLEKIADRYQKQN